MTDAPHRAPRSFSDIDEVLDMLRADGDRVSAARRLVLEALFAADGPVSADAIADGLDGQHTPLDRTSVYRNLEHFEKLGIVHHVHAGHGAGLYVLAGSGEHEYLVCERCHRVEAVEPKVLDAARSAIQRAAGYRARFSHFPIHGLCSTCAEATPRLQR
jgi:Fur family transcriptional regulator, ferric uptake regulator